MFFLARLGQQIYRNLGTSAGAIEERKTSMLVIELVSRANKVLTSHRDERLIGSVHGIPFSVRMQIESENIEAWQRKIFFSSFSLRFFFYFHFGDKFLGPIARGREERKIFRRVVVCRGRCWKMGERELKAVNENVKEREERVGGTQWRQAKSFSLAGETCMRRACEYGHPRGSKCHSRLEPLGQCRRKIPKNNPPFGPFQ
jgi:hypothetical protein